MYNVAHVWSLQRYNANRLGHWAQALEWKFYFFASFATNVSPECHKFFCHKQKISARSLRVQDSFVRPLSK